MNTDNLILRETDNLPLINKDDTLTSAELDGNFIKIYNDFLALSTANDPTLVFDIDRSYAIGEYATYNGKMWVSTIEVTGVTPDIDSLEWLDIFPTILAHEKNKDTYLDYGGANATSVAEIRAFIDAGLTSTTNLTLTTKTSTSFKIESSTGTDVILPQATVRDAGLLNADDKVKLENTTGINTGDQTLASLNAEDVDNKVTDFTTINDTLYPTTQAVDTYLTAQVPTLVETFLDSNVEVTTNKATDFTTVNDTLYPSVKAVDDQLDLKVTSNTAITGATKTKITYDSKGLVTSGADATTADIADSTNKRYVTDANLTVIGNTSGTNTGDQIISDATLTTTDITTNNVSTSKHGFVPKAPNNTTQFLRGDGTWATPASGSSGGIWGIANSSGVYTYYATWALAVASATSGQCIELFADITETTNTYILKNGVNVNGNGHTITATMAGASACLDDGGVSVICDISNITINKTTGKGVSITNTSSIITGNCILKGVDVLSSSLALYGQLSGWTITGASRYPVDMYSTAILTNVYISTTETSAVAIGLNASTVRINNCVIKSSGAGISGASGGGIINNCTVSANSGGISCVSGEVNNCSIITNTLIALTLGAGSTANNCYARSASGIATSGTSTSYFNECTIVSDANVLGSSTPNFTNCKMWSKADWVLNGGGGGKVINCHLISGYNNVSGWVINEPTSNTYVIDCILEVANSGTTAIRSTTTPTLYLKGNSVRGTTNFKSAGIVNGQTNTADAQGNVILN